MWMGIRQSKSASHLPARKRETGHSELERNADVNEVKVQAETLVPSSTSLVGLRDVFVKLRIIFEK